MNAVAAPQVSQRQKTFQFVQVVVSPRAGGLSVRLNLNPDGRCNFDCVYCDVRRTLLCGAATVPDVGVMLAELEEVLDLIRSGRGEELAGCAGAPSDCLRLGHVALSGNGEPTLCPVFEEVVERVMHLRAQGNHGFFKVALITNSTGLLEPHVRKGLRLLTAQDEVWAKLDAGSEGWFRQVNQADLPFAELLQTLQRFAQGREVILQSLFPRIQGRAVPLAEQDAFAARVEELRRNGARITSVQVYSASRLPVSPRCGHASLADLSAIARRVRETSGLHTTVF